MPKCDNCGKEAELQEYKIVDDLGTRYRNLCDECAKDIDSGKSLLKQANHPNNMKSTQNPVITIGKQDKSSSQTYMIALYVIGVLFLIAAVIMYAISVSNNYGVANIQSTVFAAANFVAAIVCFVGGSIIKALKKD